MRYVKGYWNEGRGDAFDSWGRSWWYFETDDTGNVLRQVGSYENGIILRYDESHLDDEYGRLAEKPVLVEQIGASGSSISKHRSRAASTSVGGGYSCSAGFAAMRLTVSLGSEALGLVGMPGLCCLIVANGTVA
ncbi:MAG TPA: hypothetical protein VGI81_20700 [Tepidisphaeraceae bacterium]|jgi:hypothetical protein